MLIPHEGRTYQTRSGYPDSCAKYSSAVPFPSANTWFVGVPSLWSRPGGVLQEYGIVVSRQLASGLPNLRLVRHPTGILTGQFRACDPNRLITTVNLRKAGYLRVVRPRPDQPGYWSFAYSTLAC